ncbi:MAG: YqiA/YcfP family alpha/beta fold hydrolase, partial [Planctomycetota bacterium]
GDMVDLTCSGLLSDVETVVDDLADRYANIVLVGSSMGGWAAAWFAAKWPERVAATASPAATWWT